jgi:hypothetical protein
MLVPNWDGRERVLRLGDWVVKKFQVPARNQELVLAAFQEEYFIEISASADQFFEYDLEIENFAAPVPIEIDLALRTIPG